MKALAIFKREYLQAARGRSFLLITLLTPLFISAMLTLPLLVAGAASTSHVVVVDGTGQLGRALDAELARRRRVESRYAAAPTGFAPPPPKLELEQAPLAPDYPRALERSLAALDRGCGAAGAPAAVLAFSPRPPGEDPAAQLYMRCALEASIRRQLDDLVTSAVARRRVADRLGSDLDAVLRDASVDEVRVGRVGQTTGDISALLCFAVLLAVVVSMANQGAEVMRSIVLEKNARITEVLMSVVRPLDLLIGKIAAFAAVGLTQVCAWAAVSFIVSLVSRVAAPLQAASAMPALPPSSYVTIAVFFLLGYAMCVCVYAMVGVIARDDREAQQLVSPMMLAVMTPVFFAAPIHANPDSPLVVLLSMFPPTVPTTMLVRMLVSDPPAWQIAIAVFGTLATTAALYVIAAKVFRIGIWSRGARPSLGTLARWLRSARA